VTGNRIAAIALALALTGGVVWLMSQPSVAPPIEAGRRAPTFALADLSGGRHALEDLRGQVVLVNFWATWCKPCEDEMPAMERLYQQLRGQGFELLAVSVDDETAPVEEFSGRLGLSFPILHDAAKEVSRDYQSVRYPESFLIDRDGILVERYIGPREWDAAAYVDRIERLLGGEG